MAHQSLAKGELILWWLAKKV